MTEIYVEPDFMGNRVNCEDDDLGYFRTLAALRKFIHAKVMVEPNISVGRRYFAQFHCRRVFYQALLVSGIRGWAIVSRRVDDRVPNVDRLNHPVMVYVYGEWSRIFDEVVHHFPEFPEKHPDFMKRAILSYLDLKHLTNTLEDLLPFANISWRKRQMNMQLTEEERNELSKLMLFAHHFEVYLLHDDDTGDDE